MRLIFLLPLFFCFQSFGQNFAINNSFYTLNSSGEYEVYFDGNAQFNDSMLVVYSVKSADSLQQVLFSDSVDFRVNPVVYPQAFTYNAIDSTLHVALGTYSNKSLIIEMFSEVEGARRETIYINIPIFEAALENEE